MIKLAKLGDRPEIFHSIQGEGKNLGTPSVFIRLSLCNLYCVWCDTDYTWNWEGTDFRHVNDRKKGYHKFSKEEQILAWSDNQIVDEVAKFNCNNIVLTGGEPLVQRKDLVDLVALLRRRGEYRIEVETNGTLVPQPELDHLLDQYNVSIKLSNSGVATQDRQVPESIRFFADTPKSNFKFVVDEAEDLSEIVGLLERYGIDADRVYLMPQGTRAQQLNNRMEWLMGLCEEHGFHFTDRLHIRIHGNRRGI